MRRFIALVLFTSTFVFCSVATAYAHKLPPEVRAEYVIKAPADVTYFVAFDRPATPFVKLEVAETVLEGSVLPPEAHCNSPGIQETFLLLSSTRYIFNYGLRH